MANSNKAVPDEKTPCPLCPSSVRNFYAVADNAARAVEYAMVTGDWKRARRKLAELKLTTAEFRVLVDAHFADERHFNGPLLRDARNA